jgi:hypothetical protein
MHGKLKSARAACVAMALVVIGALAVAPGAFAHTGEYAEFNQCPSTNPSVASCLYSKVTSGEVILGNKKVPIVNPVILQGGVSEPDETTYSTFYGSSCYIGSSSSPIWWNLTTGKTSPPPPNTSISGAVGKSEFKGGDEGILRLNGNKLVDNAWAAPGANGCGGFGVELILNPIINASVGVPAAAGKNTAILTGIADESPVEYVNEH